MENKSHTWLHGGGEMGRRIRDKDWSPSPLGLIEDWPLCLQNTINIAVETSVPTVICWSEELTMIYNDAFDLLLGEKPDALGRPFLEVWSEMNGNMKPQVNKALAGEPCCFENMELTITRSEQPEQAWFDFYFSPLRDETGSIVGLFNTAIERTQAVTNEQALHQSEERYRSLFESIDEGFCIIKILFNEQGDPVDYRFLEVNPSFTNHTGLENVVGKKRTEVGPLEESWFEIYGKVALTREAVRFEKSTENMTRFYDVYAFPFGKPEEHTIAVIFQNITERKQTKQALYKSEKHLRLATQAANMHLCEVDLVNQTLEWTNNVAHKVTFPMPKTLDEAEALLHPDDKKDVVETLGRVAEQDGDFEMEYRVIDPETGEEIWVYSAGVAIADTNVECTRIAGITKNITERKIAEIHDQFLAKLDNKLHAIGDPDQIMDTAVRLLGEQLGVDRCTYAKVGEKEDNLAIMGDYTKSGVPDMERKHTIPVFSMEARRLMHQNKPLVIDDIKKDRRITEDDEAVFKQNKIRALIRVPLHKDGQFVAKMGIHQQKPRQWLDEEVELVKKVASDCWEAIQRVRANRELRELNKTLEDRVEKRTEALKTYQNQLRSLAAELSKTEDRERQHMAAELHNNLGQLLAVGKMRLDTLQKMDLPDEVTDKVINITELLDDALKYTRELMSDLKPPPALDKENLAELFDWVAQKMEKHGLTVTIEENNEPQPLDEEVRTSLRRCTSELLYNVIKHADTDEARVIITYDRGNVRVTVEDEGKGFNMEQKPTPDKEGGFGLFNIRERMSWLGGDFAIVSEPGAGTRATLYAPLAKDSDAGRSIKSREETGTTPVQSYNQTELWRQIRVLIVDDHEMMRKGLRKLIEAEDDLTIIAEASDGEKAVKLAHKTSPDIIVMDVNLPGMDGIEATQKIVSSKQDISIIGLSLYDDAKVAEDMKNAGASSYLTKTEAFESLCATIRAQANIAR